MNTSKNLSSGIINNRDNIVRMMSEFLEVKTALVSQVEKPNIKVLKTNNQEMNPVSEGDTFVLEGHYCEKVISEKEMLLIRSAYQESEWGNNPELKLNLVSYLGYPIFWPNGEVFGTICVMDYKERDFEHKHKNLVLEFHSKVVCY